MVSKCGGVFGVARSIWDHSMFKDETFTERAAWIWLISEAKYQSGRYKTHAGEMHLDRGELCHAESFMAERWDWHKSRVHRFLNRLDANDMIDRTSRRTAVRGSNRAPERTAYQVISIRKYNDYQAVALPKRTDMTAEKTLDSEPSEPHSEPIPEPETGAIEGGNSTPCKLSLPTSEPQANREANGTIRRFKKVIEGACSEPLSAVQKATKELWSDGVQILTSLGEPEQRARSMIGRWLSRKSGLEASAEDILRAIRDAGANDTPIPIPYVSAILRDLKGGSVRRDGDDYLIPHGTEEYRAWQEQLRIANSSLIYGFPDTPGHVARAATRWPQRGANVA